MFLCQLERLRHGHDSKPVALHLAPLTHRGNVKRPTRMTEQMRTCSPLAGPVVAVERWNRFARTQPLASPAPAFQLRVQLRRPKPYVESEHWRRLSLQRSRLERSRLERTRLERTRLERTRLERTRLERSGLERLGLERSRLAWAGLEVAEPPT